ncbi:glycoside hydrolase family 43 protein [Mucilaginibacter daejeonensis]|uniref:glycoside hydrolase family 43 protein n=1 Tax=Mucilaginibacter daejeonensis TaxID=398049 RepID=UPI001D17CF8F|nr:glycoside hydrolase family 43 protein [Mucilaginibacter daejeonensis]UEG52035.1 glycoside hydrolase family 43 protein [Mucilaginibacter daejeonensis]
MNTGKCWTAALSLILLASSCVVKSKMVPPRERDMGAYLMVYFKDDTHGLYMALSKDGRSFTDVNNAKPIIAGDTIAEQKGIRDPYIFRGPDNWFYMALTDLHIFAQKEGYRNTQWERDGKAYGWGNNRGLVLMRSRDLLNWSHTVLRVDQAFPQLADIGCAWAPEMIWDDHVKKTMLYFTMRFGAGKEKVYYTYMNDAFTKMETLPKVLFEYPNGVPYIDADITKVGNKYHMFYASHDGTSGVKQAVSDSVNTGYVYDAKWYDPEPVGCEAPTVYKLIGQNKWVLIYDIYRINPHNFGFSETSDFVNFTNLGRFNEGVMRSTNFSVPKHPAVIQVTAKEAQRLANKYGLNMKF